MESEKKNTCIFVVWLEHPNILYISPCGLKAQVFLNVVTGTYVPRFSISFSLPKW